ncbi:MAG: hypothetical protein J6Z16_00155, partial [Candidatus Methanomethylophilaceae archaeon]|nr:hypothetical protein [Candidatus Methanomethylophilaceae archaeon]
EVKEYYFAVKENEDWNAESGTPQYSVTLTEPGATVTHYDYIAGDPDVTVTASGADQVTFNAKDARGTVSFIISATTENNSHVQSKNIARVIVHIVGPLADASA